MPEVEAKPESKEARPKKGKVEYPPHPLLEGLIENGIELKIAVFDRAVSSAVDGGVPETAFYNKSERHKPSKTADIWYTPHGVVCHQLGFKGYELIIVPLSHIAYAKAR